MRDGGCHRRSSHWCARSRAPEREAGIRVEQVIVDLKRLLVETVHGEADLFVKRVVGWAVAGYYHASVE